ncbi:MAG: cytochrome c3 family protein [Mucispirillum sp.]|nr:cytochrome c3 family protein [Mucispirillum sp.]
MKSIILPVLVSLLAVSAMAFAQSGEHPMPIEGKDCSLCHAPGSAEETPADPQAYSQWEKSMHGLMSIKCVTCHGDEATFKPASSTDTCLSCHPQEASVINKKVADKGEGLICSSCHPVHSFTVTQGSSKVHSK